MAVSKRITGDGPARATWPLRLSEYPTAACPVPESAQGALLTIHQLPTEDRSLPSLMYGNSGQMPLRS